MALEFYFLYVRLSVTKSLNIFILHSMLSLIAFIYLHDANPLARIYYNNKVMLIKKIEHRHDIVLSFKSLYINFHSVVKLMETNATWNKKKYI